MLTAIVGAGALLLLAAGAAKVVEPTRAAGALAALGWPSSPLLVRAGAAAEAVVGASALVVGGRLPAALVGVSYACFAAFVVVALRSGTPIGSCGCFGAADTLPRRAHVAVDAVLAAAGLVGAVAGVDAVVAATAPVVVAAVVLAGLAWLVLTARPARP
jgi:hypothetical protein